MCWLGLAVKGLKMCSVNEILMGVVRTLVAFDGRLLTADVIDTSICSVELVFRELLYKDDTEGLSRNELEACHLVRRALQALHGYEEHLSMECNRPCVAQSINFQVGRPRFKIPCDQLVYLVENRFTVPQIASIIGVSVRTIFRRLTEYEISISAQYAELSDDELDTVVTEIQNQFPMCGNRQMQGHLLSRGLRVQQARIRDSQRRVDPSGTLVRRLHTIRRRKYKVKAPRSLYHMDGNHKLIR